MIKVKNLTKRYGQHMAVNNISFNVSDGEIVGFLGPNGAGKTTTMNIITGYISATGGEAAINGHDILDEPEQAKASIGYLPEQPPVYGDMTVDEYLGFVADIKKVAPQYKEKMLNEIKDTVKVSDMSRRLIKNLSKGYRQRVGLAQAMVGLPKVLILDEPTVGLDPKQIIEMRDVITRLGKSHTIMLSSHILQEVSAVCDRVIIISKGKIVASDTPERLSHVLTHGNKMLARIKGERNKIQEALASNPVVTTVEFQGSREPGTCEVVLSGGEQIDVREPIFNCMAKNNLPILMLKSLDLTLEEIFLQVTTGTGTSDSEGSVSYDSNNQ
ncbi:MAG: ABC transporter ATP-binding protein [Clostridiales bacterium]|nr:ABC transporter ATP-binding protein [Clostridiales bacterium]